MVWLFSVVSSLPEILIVVAISLVLGKGLSAICIAMGAVGWISLCRLVRGGFIKHRGREYVLASRLLGARDLRVIFVHILPNVLHLAIITASLEVLGAIKSEVISHLPRRRRAGRLELGNDDLRRLGRLGARASGGRSQALCWRCSS